VFLKKMWILLLGVSARKLIISLYNYITIARQVKG